MGEEEKHFISNLFATPIPGCVQRDCANLDLGMESGSIPNIKITASSEKNANTAAKNGRLNSGSSWCAETNDSNPYLQIDLQTLHIICAVSTQGNFQADQWVKNYMLQSSIDGSTWIDYTQIGQVKSLKGNEDRNSEIKHILNEGVLARYLQFLPQTHHGGVCLRTEVFGVKQKPENLALGKPTNQSSTYSNALIGAAESGRAVDGNDNTDMVNKHCSHTNQDNPSWWQVDLALGHAAVYEIHVVNRFTGVPGKNNLDYKITFGNSTDVANNLECTGRYSFIQFRASAICFTNPLTTGRYVGIMTTKSQVLQLCEVEIYSRENLAFGKLTAQKGTAYDGLSSLGVDGNSETNYFKGSCTHTPSKVKPWWRVDLGQVEPVSEVYIVNRGDNARWAYRLSNFEIRVGSETSDGGVNNPKCGSGKYGVPNGEGKSFFCRPPLYGRYVTIRSLLSDALTLCEVEVYSERRACQIQALGVSSKNAFPDNSFSALSSSSSNEASKGRLNGAGAWSPSSNNNPKDYLQINLQYEFFICAVATQGKSTEDHWTTKYKLRLSLNSVDWVTYKENGTDKVFHGNSGRNDIVKHNLKEIARARFIQFQPTTYSTYKSLRVEVFGILKPAAPSQAPASFLVSALSSTSVRASWQLPPAGSRHGAITGFKLFYQRKNSTADYPTVMTIESNSTLSSDITGLHKYTAYEFQLLAFSLAGNGPISSVQEVRTNEDVPSHGPENVSSTEVNYTTFRITWAALSEKVAHGVIKMYQIRLFLKENCTSAQSELYSRFNTTTTNMVLSGLSVCAKYEVSVRGYTAMGPGPYSRAIVLQTLSVKWSKIAPSSPAFPSNSTEAGFTAKITLARFPTNAKFFQVIIITISSHYAGVVNSPESFTTQDLVTYDEAHESLVPAAYVTFQFSGNDFDNYQEFIVGNGAISNSKTRRKRSCDDNKQYYNKPLQPNTNYRVFLRVFVTEMVYVSSNFVEIKTKEKPAVKKLPEKSIFSVGELVLLTCEVTGDPEPSLTWTKSGNSTIPRAQFKNDGRILVIQDVSSRDSGVYECKASNKFGETRTSTSVIVTVPPRIAEEVSPSSVICERQTLCMLSCYATSVSPFSYSWTKNGQVPVSDGIKIMNNIIALTPRDAEDYGVYVCHATNSFGSTTYNITLLECQRSSNAVYTIKGDDSLGGNSVFYATVITLSCIVFVLLAVIGVLIWRLRRALPENRASTADKSITDNVGQNVVPRDHQMPEPGSYMELSLRPLEGQHPGPSVYKSLQGKDKNGEYYNVGLNDGKDEQEEIYHEIGNAQC